MKRAWLYICIPPTAALVVALLVRWAGSVPVPPDPGLRGLEEALRAYGFGRNGESEPSPESFESAAALRKAWSDSVKRYDEARLRNHRVQILGLWAGGAVAVIGYVAVGFWLYRQFQAPSGWKEAIEAKRALVAPAEESPPEEVLASEQAEEAPAAEPGGDYIFVDDGEAQSAFEMEEVGPDEEHKEG